MHIIWRNEIGYVTQSTISYRVYFVYKDSIIQCFPLTPEGFREAKQLLINAATLTCKQCGEYVDGEGKAIHGCLCGHAIEM